MGLNGLETKKATAYFEYDFSKHGGAVGDITVYGSGIPAGAIIDRGIVHVPTAVTSDGSATVAIKAVTSEDILAATGKASLSLNAKIYPVPVGTIGVAIRLASTINSLTFTIAAADLTAGKIVVGLEYWVTA